VLAVPHPDLMRRLPPIGELFPGDQTAVGARAGIFRRLRLVDVFLQGRLDAVGGDHDIHLGNFAVGELQLRDRAGLFEMDATMAGSDRIRRQRVGEHLEQIGPVHSIHAVPAVRVGGEDRPDHGSVHPAILRTIADFGAYRRQRFSQSQPFELPQTVRIDENTGPDLAQRIGLLENDDVDAPSMQGIRRGKAANSSPHDGGAKASGVFDTLFHRVSFIR
jgi:hypothetical protein